MTFFSNLLQRMITIRKATANDAPLLNEIGIKSFYESHGHSGPAADIEEYIAKTYTVETLIKELNNPENIFHVINYNDQPAGFSKIVLNSQHPLIKSLGVTKLERLYLLKEFYDLKLGMALFRSVLSLSKEEKQTGMWLYTWTKNERAVRFYKKNGFEIIGETFFKISDSHSNPNYVMYLKY